MPMPRWCDLRPAVTLRELYPPRTVLMPRVSWRWNRWVTPSPALADLASGTAIPLAGKMPVVVSRAVLSDRIRDALGGRLPMADSAIAYFDEEEHAARIREAIAGGSKIALTYPMPGEEISANDCLVSPSFLSEIGDKERLGEWAGADRVPWRDCVPLADLVRRAATRLPVVVKVVTGEPASGGVGVRLCRSVNDLVNAADAMASCEFVVVEEWLDLVRSECLTYAVGPEGDVRYLGAAQQIVTGMRFRGNRVDDTRPAAAAVEAGGEIVARAAERGYVGFAGIDYGLLADGSFRILDLNFRINASTPLVVLRQAMLDAIGPHHAISASWTCARPFGEFIVAIRRGWDLGWLQPLVVFDPEASPWGGPPLLLAILVGADEDELASRTNGLAARGLTPLFPTL